MKPVAPALDPGLTPTGEGESALADYFRDPEFVADSALAWQMDQHSATIEALRGLFQGPGGVVRLRVWMLLTLTSQGRAFWNREELEQLFHPVRPEATDNAIKRLREAALLTWDDTQRHYAITPLAQHTATMLSPLSQPVHDELAGLLSQVVGADQLGTLDAGQVRMLQAQLGRLHHEFADAIASGSEFRLREARKRYDRAARLIDKASDTITAIISNARGQLALEQAARALGQAQSRLLAMASQFNRALQQVDRQRVTLGTTGITSTDVKRWLQTLGAGHALPHLADDAVALPVGLTTLAPHELLDVTEAEFERDRPVAALPDALPSAQAAPVGDLTAVALPHELFDLSSLLQGWELALATAPHDATDGTSAQHSVSAALLGVAHGSESPARYAQVAYKAQLLPLLGDAQARELPGATGELARQSWRVQWSPDILHVDHPAVTHLSSGQLIHHPDGPSTPRDSNA